MKALQQRLNLPAVSHLVADKKFGGKGAHGLKDPQRFGAAADHIAANAEIMLRLSLPTACQLPSFINHGHLAEPSRFPSGQLARQIPQKRRLSRSGRTGQQKPA